MSYAARVGRTLLISLVLLVLLACTFAVVVSSRNLANALPAAVNCADLASTAAGSLQCTYGFHPMTFPLLQCTCALNAVTFTPCCRERRARCRRLFFPPRASHLI